jgi:cytochrome oxidase Cu insertion factor (SCO1/SenC/PrrC family)
MTNLTARVKSLAKAWMESSGLTFLLPIAVVVVVAAALGGAWILSRPSSAPAPAVQKAALANPDLDPGTQITPQKPAPDFTLTDQFGKRISLRSFRGRVVVLYFADSRCTTVCPLSTTAMVSAKRMLGSAGGHVQLLGINANPEATAVKNVRAYSLAHRMMLQWHFLTGPLPELKRVWRAYGIEAAIVHGQVDHSPAMYVIDQRGRLVRLYWTKMAYAGVEQQAEVLAQEISSLLPGHPSVRTKLSSAQVPLITPRATVSLPRVGGGSVRLGPSRSPRLYLFFATWASQTSNLAGQLEALNGYQAAARAGRLPELTAVDEGSVEPYPRAASRLLRALPRPLSYPVAIDQSGRVADGYEVEDQPWFVLVSPAGRVLFYYDVSTAGWPNPSALAHHVRVALARAHAG